MDTTTIGHICAQCSVPFAITEELNDLRHKDGGVFYCPNGHPQRYARSQASQLAEKDTALKEAQDELRDAKIEITRLKCELIKAQKPTLYQRLLKRS